MAGDVKRTIQMLLDAEDLGTQKIEDLIGSIEKLEKAQRDYAKSGKVSAQTIDELRERVVALKDASRQLTARGALIDAFNAQNEVVTKATERLRLNEKALADYKTELGSVGAVSDQQAQKMARLEKAVAGASEKLTKASAAAATTRERLGKLGITDLTKAQQQLANYAERTGAALRETESDLKTYSRRVRETKEAEAALRAEVERRVTADQQAAARAVESQRRIAAAFDIRTKAEIASLRVQRQADLEAAFNPNIARQAELEAAALARQNAIRERLIRVINRTGVEIGKETLAQKRNTDATNANTAAKTKAAGATTRLGNAHTAFASKGKTALTVFQRIRGQALALASAYIGVYQAIDLARRSLDVSQQRQAAEIRLGVANNGDAKKTGEDLQFVREQADRLGLSLTELSNSYSRFRIAGDGANLTLETQRKVFTDFSEVATVLRLSTDETAGIFKALEQSFSKGKVQAEELRGQLGDRLPGAFTKFAKAIGRSTAELDKLIEDGRISANLLPLLGDLLAEEVALKLPEAVSSFQSTIGRLKTAFDDFVQTIADSGFKAQIEELALQLTAFFQSNDGKLFANNLSNAFSFLVAVVQNVIKYFGYLKNPLIAIAAIKFGAIIARWTTAAIANTTAIVGMSGAIKTAGFNVKALGTAVKTSFGPIGILIAVATEAIAYFALAADDAAGSVSELAEATDRLAVAQGEQLAVQIRLAEASRAEADLKRALAEDKKKKAEEELAAAQDQLAKLKTNTFSYIVAEGGGYRESRELQKQKAETEELEARIAGLRDEIGGYSNDIDAVDRVLGAKRAEFEAEQKALAERVQGQLLELQAEFNDESNQAKLKSDDNYFNDFVKRYKEVFKEIARIDGDYRTATFDEIARKLQEAVARVRADRVPDGILPGGADDKGGETAANKRIKAERRLQDAIADIRRDALKEQQDLLSDQLRLIDEEIDKEITRIKNLANDAAAAGVGNAKELIQPALDQLELIRLVRQREARQKQIADDEKSAEEELQRLYRNRETILNNLLEARRAKLEQINTQEQLGVISSADAEAKRAEVQQQYLDDTIEAIKALKDFIDQNPDQLSKFINVDAVVAGLETLQIEIENTKTKTQELADQFREDFAVGMSDVIVNIGTNIADVIRGFQSWGDAIKNIRDTFLNFVADFLINIAKMIAKQAILNALQQGKSSGGFFDFVAGLIAPTKHTGGIVGASGPTRTVSPLAFAAAARYHSGGIAGLAPDEVPTILRKGEEVLTESDPRHRNNGGMGAAGKTEVKVVNTIDPGSFVSEGLNTKPGQQAFMNFIRANKAAVRSAIS